MLIFIYNVTTTQCASLAFITFHSLIAAHKYDTARSITTVKMSAHS